MNVDREEIQVPKSETIQIFKSRAEEDSVKKSRWGSYL